MNWNKLLCLEFRSQAPSPWTFYVHPDGGLYFFRSSSVQSSLAIALHQITWIWVSTANTYSHRRIRLRPAVQDTTWGLHHQDIWVHQEISDLDALKRCISRPGIQTVGKMRILFCGSRDEVSFLAWEIRCDGVFVAGQSAIYTFTCRSVVLSPQKTPAEFIRLIH